ncbi:MAG: nitrogenase component 1 [Coprococcus sp.]
MIFCTAQELRPIHEISRCKDYEEYQTMSEANFNLVLHPEARFAAEDFHNRLQIPFIELRRLYQTDKIASQYQAFGKVLGVTFSDEVYREKAEETVAKFKEKRYRMQALQSGECMNGDPFEMALAMIKYGFKVPEIYGTLTAENFI